VQGPENCFGEGGEEKSGEPKGGGAFTGSDLGGSRVRFIGFQNSCVHLQAFRSLACGLGAKVVINEGCEFLKLAEVPVIQVDYMGSE